MVYRFILLKTSVPLSKYKSVLGTLTLLVLFFGSRFDKMLSFDVIFRKVPLFLAYNHDKSLQFTYSIHI